MNGILSLLSVEIPGLDTFSRCKPRGGVRRVRYAWLLKMISSKCLYGVYMHYAKGNRGSCLEPMGRNNTKYEETAKFTRDQLGELRKLE